MNPFTLITEPTAVRRIQLLQGLELGRELPPDGWSFEQFSDREHWGLSINHREENGEVSHRIITARKTTNRQLVADTFATITIGLAGHKDCMYVERVPTNQN